MHKPKFVVIIPTYLRTEALSNCLRSLERQTIVPDEILVVMRESDAATHDFIDQYKKNHGALKIISGYVGEPGFLPPLKEGLKRAKGDYVAVVDDDMIMCPEWVENALITFHRYGPKLGAVVGAQVNNKAAFGTIYPAKLTWFGRFSVPKNKHERTWKVNAFCEGNMVFRGEVSSELEVDLRLNKGALAHHGLDFGLQLIGKKWKMLYEPLLNGEHAALRGPRNSVDMEEIRYFIDNLALIIIKHFGRRRLNIFILYNILVGQRDMPGFLYGILKKEIKKERVLTAREALFSHLFQRI